MNMKDIIGYVVVALVLSAAPAFAQGTTVAPATDIDVLVIAATGDPVTLVPIATRRTPIAAGSPLCNQLAIPAPVGTLVNPTVAQVPDPFNAGRFCRPPTPIGLANATALRVVAVYNSAAGVSGRSPAGVLPFDIQGTLVPPAAPISVDARP